MIYARITGFGQTGPARQRPAHDLSYQAMAGLLLDAARSPAVPAIPCGDLSSGTFAAFAIAAALFARERTGLGTAIDVSITDGLVSWMTPYLVPHMSGEAPFEVHEPAYGIFTCADGTQLTLSIAHEDYFWSALCHALALPDRATLQAVERRQRARDLRREITAAIAAHDRSHWSALFDAKGIAWGPVHDLDGVVTDPHFQARGLFAHVQGAAATTARYIPQPVKFSAYRTAILRGPPELGEHTDEVLASTRRTNTLD